MEEPKECLRCGKKNIKVAYFRKVNGKEEPVYKCASCGYTFFPEI